MPVLCGETALHVDQCQGAGGLRLTLAVAVEGQQSGSVVGQIGVTTLTDIWHGWLQGDRPARRQDSIVTGSDGRAGRDRGDRENNQRSLGLAENGDHGSISALLAASAPPWGDNTAQPHKTNAVSSPAHAGAA
jgi:hypothetical protein